MAYVIWFTGISGAGKTTQATLLATALKTHGLSTALIDGDDARSFFGKNDLGYTRPERILNVKRIAFAAHMLAENGIHAVVANIAPYFEVRDFIRARIQNYIQIYLATTITTVTKRDPKGLYSKYRRGEIAHMVGLDDPYDIPRNPHLVVDTSFQSISASAECIFNFCFSTVNHGNW